MNEPKNLDKLIELYYAVERFLDEGYTAEFALEMAFLAVTDETVRSHNVILSEDNNA